MDSEALQGVVAKDHLEQEAGLIRPATTEATKTDEPAPSLYKLPTELRLMIFKDCIASGHPQFMQVSRVLQHEGQVLISKEGTYRMHLNYSNDNNGRRPSQEVTQTIQNVHVTINTTELTDNLTNFEANTVPLGWDRLRPFSASPDLRGQCQVHLKVGCVLIALYNDRVLSFLCHLNGFERVVLRIEANGTKHTGPWSWMCSGPNEKVALDLISQLLKKCLGKAEVVEGMDGFLATFYPRKHAEAVAEGVEG